MNKFSLLGYLLVVTAISAHPVCNAQENTQISQPIKTWNFQVYLNKNQIGTHSFEKFGEDENYEIRIAADLSVKILFFTAYTYVHRNRESWRDGCLLGITSQTDDNGDLFSVSGQQNADAFQVVANKQSTQLPRCITTFAYWDPQFLTQTALLNSQTGEYMSVDINGPYTDRRIDRGKSVEAKRYQIKNETVDIKLWYSLSGDWLALESALESDRTLRYERI